MWQRLLSGWLGASVASLALLFLALGTFSALALIASDAALAAEEAAPADPPPPEPAPPETAPAEEGDAMNVDELVGDLDEIPDDILDDPVKEPGAAGAAATTPPPPKQESYLQRMGKSLGWFFGIVFLGLSFTMVALFVMNLLTAPAGERAAQRPGGRF